MRNYRVEFTGAENTACYTGEWYLEIAVAESYLEAFDLIKEYLIAFGLDPEQLIFRAKTDEDTEWVYDQGGLT